MSVKQILMNFRVTKKPHVTISKARSTASVTRDGKETALVVKVSQNLKHLSLTICILQAYVMRCAIWYHLHNLKNVKNTYGRMLLLIKVELFHECFLRFLNCANGTQSRKASHMFGRRDRVLSSYPKLFRENLVKFTGHHYNEVFF